MKLTDTQSTLLAKIQNEEHVEFDFIEDWMMEDGVDRDQLNILKEGQLILDLRELHFQELINIGKEDDFAYWAASIKTFEEGGE
jgi:hypothetical protein